MNILDYNKYKLTVHKGMTVPKGYVDGSLTPIEAYEYLQKLGISDELYEEVRKSFVFVPANYSITNIESGKTYSSSFVPSKPDEGGDFDKFLSRIQGESDKWDIQETGEEEDPAMNEVSEITPEQFELGLAQALGPNPSLADIKAAALVYGSWVDEQKEKANQELEGDDRAFMINRIEIKEHETAERLSKYVVAYKVNQDVQNAANAPVVLEAAIKERAANVIATYNYSIATVDGVQEGHLGINFRPIKNRVKHGTSIHMGSLLAAAEIAGRQDLIEEYMKDKKGSLLVGHIQRSIDLQLLFPNSVDPEGNVQRLKELIGVDPKNLPETFELMEAAKTLSYYMRAGPSGVDAESPEKALKQLIASIENYGTETTQEYRDRVKSLRGGDAVQKLFGSMSSGNELAQSMISLALDGFTTPDVKLLKEKFSVLDTIYETRDTFGDTMVGVADKILSKEDLPMKDRINELKKYILESTTQQPLKIRTLTVPQVTSRIESLMSGLQKNVISAPNSLFDKSPTDTDPPVESMFRDIGVTDTHLLNKLRTAVMGALKSEEMSTSKNKYAHVFLRENPAVLTRELKAQGIKDSDGNPMSDEFLEKVSETIGRYARAETAKLQAALGGLKNKLTDAMVRGTIALAIHALAKSLNSDDQEFNAESEAFDIIKMVLSDSMEKFDPSIGSFISSDAALFGEVMTRARVMPPVNLDTKEVYLSTGLRNFLRDDYRDMHGQGTEPTDIQLLQQMSHTDSYIPSQYILENNIRQSAATISTSSKGKNTSPPVFATRDEHIDFMRHFSSVSHNPHHTDTEEDRVDEEEHRATMTGRYLKEVLGHKKIKPLEIERTIRNGTLTADDFTDETSVVSILAAAIGSYRKGGVNKDGSFTEEHLRYAFDVADTILERRIRAAGIDSQEFIDHFKQAHAIERQSIERGGRAGIGQYLEVTASIPEAIHHFKESGGIASTVQPIGYGDLEDPEEETGGIQGFTWQDTSGNTHEFGKLRGVSNGAIDRLHVVTSADGTKVDLHPVEIKMYDKIEKDAHLGSIEHVTRYLANLWKNTGRPRITFHSVNLVNAPYESDQGTSSGFYAVNIDTQVKQVQKSGRTFHETRPHNLKDRKR